MRIACISASRIPSDTANSIQVMKVCQAFAQLGHNVSLIVPGPQLTGTRPTDLQSHYGLLTFFKIEWLPARSRRLFPWIAVPHARRLGADLLYVWPLQSAALGLLDRMPVLLEVHDLPGGRFGPLWLRLFFNLPGRKRLLPISAALQHALDRKYGSPRGGDVLVAPDGVDLERYSHLPEPRAARRQLDLAPAPTVLCTGHLYPGRGADLFLELAKRFSKARFVWVGGRPEDTRFWELRALSADLSNVTFTGFVPNERIPLYQAAADVVLMPYGKAVATSSGGNTAEVCSPMKMFEYMAAGRAILTSDLPVLREVLDDSTAVFCSAENIAEWETALGTLLADGKRRQALGQRARAAVSKYDWKKRAQRVLEGFA